MLEYEVPVNADVLESSSPEPAHPSFPNFENSITYYFIKIIPNIYIPVPLHAPVTK